MSNFIEPIKIETKATYKQIIYSTFLIMYRKKFALLITIFGLTSVVLGIITKSSLNNSSLLLFGIILVLITPLFTFLIVYDSVKTTNFEIDYDSIRHSCGPIGFEYEWNQLNKIVISKSSIVLVHHKLITNVIPIADFTNTQLNEFKILVKDSGVHTNIK